jgi:hypothetical protein
MFFHKTPSAYRSGNKIRQEKMMVMMCVVQFHFEAKINGQNRIPKIYFTCTCGGGACTSAYFIPR